VSQISRRYPSKSDTELAKIFLEGKTVSEAMEIVGKQRTVNYASRKAFGRQVLCDWCFEPPECQ
jgi:hypothetical protein